MAHESGFLKAVQEAKKHIKECTVSDVANWQKEDKDFILIDTREDREWEKGHIPGAIHLGKGVIERDIEKAIPNKTSCLVLYCGGGFRSALAAHSIQLMGYDNVISMDGGVRGWKEAGHPLAD